MVNQGLWLKESGQWVGNVDQTHLVVASGQPVLQKTTTFHDVLPDGDPERPVRRQGWRPPAEEAQQRPAVRLRRRVRRRLVAGRGLREDHATPGER